MVGPRIPMLDTAWMVSAECSGEDPNLFFPPDNGKKILKEQKEKALSFCNACEVKEECRDYAIENRIREGMWGGLDPQQLKRILRGR